MKKGVILYKSKYGATEKYARWLSEETGFDVMETKKATAKDISEYDVIVLGGGVYASSIAGLGFLKKNISALKKSKIAVFAVGASPYDEAALEQTRAFNFKNELSGIPLFYCRGMWDKTSMKAMDKMLCSMLRKAVAKQSAESIEPWQKALLSAPDDKPCDWTDKEYLRPLIEYING